MGLTLLAFFLYRNSILYFSALMCGTGAVHLRNPESTSKTSNGKELCIFAPYK
jgi:hypothetical protein